MIHQKRRSGVLHHFFSFSRLRRGLEPSQTCLRGVSRRRQAQMIRTREGVRARIAGDRTASLRFPQLLINIHALVKNANDRHNSLLFVGNIKYAISIHRRYSKISAKPRLFLVCTKSLRHILKSKYSSLYPINLPFCTIRRKQLKSNIFINRNPFECQQKPVLQVLSDPPVHLRILSPTLHSVLLPSVPTYQSVWKQVF